MLNFLGVFYKIVPILFSTIIFNAQLLRIILFSWKRRLFVNWGKKSWGFCFNSNDLYFEVQFRCESSFLTVDDLPHGVLFDTLISSTLIAYYLRSYFSRQSQFFSRNFSFHEWIHCHRQQSFRMLNVLILTTDVFNHCLLVSNEARVHRHGAMKVATLRSMNHTRLD